MIEIKVSQKYSLHFSGYLVAPDFKPVTKLKGEGHGE